MTAPVIQPTVAVPLPTQFTSKVDKADRRRLQLGADSYVHSNEQSDTQNQALVYDRHRSTKHMKTSR